jgi:E3 ubiquitin-protein ligase RNF14
MADDDEREEELSTLSAIFPELLLDPKEQFSASLELPVAPTRPLLIRFIPSRSPETNSKTFYLGTEVRNVAYIERDIELTHLPPLSLKVTLPNQYPSASPPKIRLSAQHNWLPKDKLAELASDVDTLWEEYGHCQILFAYIDHLQQAAERGFDLDQSADGCLVLPVTMEERLMAFSSETKQTIFNAGTYDCGICLEPKKGLVCYQLESCGHVFCRQCLQDFYNNAIEEGDIAGVKCLAPDCGEEHGRKGAKKVKRKCSIQPKELLAMGIEESVVRRYVELKRKKKLEADKNTIYCPRKWCQGIARRKEYPPIPADLSTYELESSSDEEHEDQKPTTANGDAKSKDNRAPPTPADRLAICEKCQYAFCRICYTGWHGEFARCHPRDPNELSAEDKASYEWILLHTSPCPSCNSPTQKTMGCNHMKCFQCNTHFCYLCGSWLDGQMPYTHFNTRGTECYQRLFELEEGDEGQDPADGRGFGGMRRWEQMALEIAREAEAEEAAAIAQAEEDARAARETRAREDMAERPGAVVDGPPIVDAVQPGGRNGGRRQRNPFPAHPPAQGAANAVRGHERNRGAGNAGVQARPGLVVEDREQAELQRFVELALRDEEDAWDSDDLGDDDEGFVIR